MVIIVRLVKAFAYLTPPDVLFDRLIGCSTTKSHFPDRLLHEFSIWCALIAIGREPPKSKDVKNKMLFALMVKYAWLNGGISIEDFQRFQKDILSGKLLSFSKEPGENTVSGAIWPRSARGAANLASSGLYWLLIKGPHPPLTSYEPNKIRAQMYNRKYNIFRGYILFLRNGRYGYKKAK